MMTKTMEDTKGLFEAMKKPDASGPSLDEAELKRLAIGYTSLYLQLELKSVLRLN